jgi:hypothetical protein
MRLSSLGGAQAEKCEGLRGIFRNKGELNFDPFRGGIVGVVLRNLDMDNYCAWSFVFLG